MTLRDLAEWLCIAVIAAGCAVVYWPLGLIVGGMLGLVWFVWGLEDDDGAE